MKKICLLTILGLFVIAEAKPQNNQGNNIQWNEERQELTPASQEQQCFTVHDVSMRDLKKYPKGFSFFNWNYH